MATNSKPKPKDYTYAVGRRKTAIARVRLYVRSARVLSDKPSQVMINGKPMESYFPAATDQARLVEPLKVTNTLDKFVVTVRVVGGGKNSQLTAITHGLSRTLSATDTEAYRKILKTRGLLTRDPRARERRKVGTGGKARRQKQSPKR